MSTAGQGHAEVSDLHAVREKGGRLRPAVFSLALPALRHTVGIGGISLYFACLLSFIPPMSKIRESYSSCVLDVAWR